MKRSKSYTWLSTLLKPPPPPPEPEDEEWGSGPWSRAADAHQHDRSDSEYECSSSPVAVSSPSPPLPQQEKSSRKRPKAAAASTGDSASNARKTKKEKLRELFGSDSEDEIDPPPPPAKKQNTKKTPSTGKTCDLFQKIIKAEEKARSCGSKDERVLYSSFTTRLAAGRQRRAAALRDGAFYIDLKIYKADDALGSAPQTLYKKALVAVKLQAAEGSPPWVKLQQFVLEAYDLLKEHEPVLYKD